MKRQTTQSESPTGVTIRQATKPWPRYWPQQDQARFVELAPTASPGKNALALGFFAIIWNGVTWTIIAVLWSRGEFADSWFLAIFLGVFALAGLAVLAAFAHQLLAGLHAPPARLAIERTDLLLGERIRALVGQELNARTTVNKLAITLICREWVRYRQGTDTKTEQHTVSEQTTVLVESDGRPRSDPMSAETHIEIPFDAMHSFEASDNRIEWLVKIQLDVPKWPDVVTEFKLNVLPRLAAQDPSAGEESAP